MIDLHITIFVMYIRYFSDLAWELQLYQEMNVMKLMKKGVGYVTV